MSRGFDHSLLPIKNRLVVREFIIRLQPANDQRPTTSDKRLPSNKKPATPATLMVPEIGTERQSRRDAYQLRKCTCQEDRPILRPCASWTHQEYDILPALQRRLDLRKVVRTVHGLLVHFQDHIAAIQTEVFGERSLLHILHHHALARRNAQPIGQTGGDAANRNPEL